MLWDLTGKLSAESWKHYLLINPPLRLWGAQMKSARVAVKPKLALLLHFGILVPSDLTGSYLGTSKDIRMKKCVNGSMQTRNVIKCNDQDSILKRFSSPFWGVGGFDPNCHYLWSQKPTRGPWGGGEGGIISEGFHRRQTMSCRSGKWAAWRCIDTLMQWTTGTEQ